MEMINMVKTYTSEQILDRTIELVGNAYVTDKLSQPERAMIELAINYQNLNEAMIDLCHSVHNGENINAHMNADVQINFCMKSLIGQMQMVANHLSVALFNTRGF